MPCPNGRVGAAWSYAVIVASKYPRLEPYRDDLVQDKQRIKVYNDRPTRIQALRNALQAEWARITHEEILAVVDSTVERVSEVVEADGGHTEF